MTSPKILLVSDYFYPHWTGLSKSLYYLLEALDGEIPFTVLTVRYSKTLEKEEQLFHSTIHREDPLFSFSRAKYSFRLLWRFIQLAPSHSIIFVNSPNTNVLPLALLAKLFGKKLYIFHQGDLILPKGFMNRIIERVFDISSYLALKLANKVSTYTRDYAEQSRVLKPFLDKFTPLLFPLPAQFLGTFARKRHSGIRFGFAGRFVEEKGFDILFQAIPGIVNAVPNAKFLYAGELHLGYEDFFGENKALYESVKDHVQLLGLLNDKELTAFYQSLDFLIVPSRSDCFNLVQAEAMRLGVPCISSDIPGLRVLVRETGFGILFKKGDAHALTKQAISIVKRKESLAVYHKKVLTILDSEKATQALRSFFLE